MKVTYEQLGKIFSILILQTQNILEDLKWKFKIWLIDGLKVVGRFVPKILMPKICAGNIYKYSITNNKNSAECGIALGKY